MEVIIVGTKDEFNELEVTQTWLGLGSFVTNTINCPFQSYHPKIDWCFCWPVICISSRIASLLLLHLWLLAGYFFFIWLVLLNRQSRKLLLRIKIFERAIDYTILYVRNRLIHNAESSMVLPLKMCCHRYIIKLPISVDYFCSPQKVQLISTHPRNYQ